MKDQLTEIPQSEWPQLQVLYEKDWPENLLGYYNLDNYIKWTRIDPEIKNLKIYSLNGDWSDGTFLIIDRYQLFIHTLDGSKTRLKTALSLLDWTKGFEVNSVLDRYMPVVLDVIKSKNLESDCDYFLLYYLPKSLAQQIQISECPNDIILKPLSERHAEIADKLWPHRHEGSLYYLKRLTKFNLNIGAFTTGNDELVSWCFRAQGPLGILQTKPSHMRRGLGSLVVTAITKILGEMDQDPFAFIAEENTASRKMVEKLGYQRIDSACYIVIQPTEPFTWNDD